MRRATVARPVVEALAHAGAFDGLLPGAATSASHAWTAAIASTWR